MTTDPIDWDDLSMWGNPATCVHVAAWAADGRHDDVTDDR